MTTDLSTIIPVPSLSQSGWITASAEKADALLSHFYVSDAMQSSLFPGKVANIQVLVEKYGHDPSEFVQQLKVMLERYLYGFYPQGVDVTARFIDVNTNAYNVTLTIVIIENGKRYNFANLINMSDSKIAGIVRAMNEGD